MKTIRLATCNDWPDYLPFSSTLTSKLLSKSFEIIRTDQNPDFVICSVAGDPRDVFRYRCPRILITGEPVTPDFTLYDYGVGFDFIDVPDYFGKNRFFRLPYFFWPSEIEITKSIATPPSKEDARRLLSSKTRFCNFISSHQTQSGHREWLMRTVGTYKRIDSAGTYMNNMDGFVVPLYQRDKKIAFQSHYKFTIAAESMRFPGFVTEKIVHAFCAHTIPIYLGDPLVTRTFNSRAFINAGDFNSAEELIKEIERIDNDDSVFVEMLCEPKFSQDGYFWNTISEYERFLQSIFSQDSSAALRRQSSFDGGNYELKRTYPNISLIRKVYHKMRSLIRKK